MKKRTNNTINPIINKILNRRKSKPNFFGPYSYNSTEQNTEINKAISAPPKPIKFRGPNRCSLEIALERLAKLRKGGFKTPTEFKPHTDHITIRPWDGKIINPGIKTIYCGYTMRGRGAFQIRKITSTQPITDTKIQQAGKLTEFGKDNIYYNDIQYTAGPAEKWHTLDPMEMLYGTIESHDEDESFEPTEWISWD